MLWRDVIDLMPVTEQQGEFGGITEVIGDPLQVICNEKSVRQSEFYQAAAAGMKPEIVIEIMHAEYDHAQLTFKQADENFNGVIVTRYKDVLYDILRTYSKNQERIELVLTRSNLRVD